MRSSSRGAIAAVLAFGSALGAGCGGNYSNADVEFAAAVPRRADVTVSVPLQASSSSGLSDGSLTSSALLEPSRTASDTRRAADEVDQMAGFFITILELATRADPTTRTPELRIWGPWDNDKAPGWQLQLAITRQPVQVDSSDPSGPREGFFWQIQYKERTALEWRALVNGFYEPGEIRRGRGLVQVLLAEFRASGMATAQDLAELGALARLELFYDIRVDQPHTVVMRATSDSAEQGTVAYQELASGAGQLAFDLRRPSDPDASHVWAISRWTSDGRGRGDLAVVAGNAAGATAVECWNGQQQVVYVSRPWNGVLEGLPGACAFGPP